MDSAREPRSETSPDWTESLDTSMAEALRALPFDRLHAVPLPRRQGVLPFGHELRILRRRLISGGTSSLDPSGLWKVYRALLRRDERTCFDGLMLRRALREEDWRRLLGETWDEWRARDVFEEDEDGWRCRFVVVPVQPTKSSDPLLLTADPFYRWFHNRVHIGQDSLTLMEFLLDRGPSSVGRLLDVGTGSGVLLLALASKADSALGVDINPRAVRAASFNAVASGLPACRVDHCNIFDPPPDFGRFDTVLWNAPLRFLPDAEKEDNIDGDGGDLGIAVTLDFLGCLPELLSEQGTGFVMTAAPILRDGSNRLEKDLGSLCGELGLDVVAHPLQLFWDPARRDFLGAHGIEHFETVVLEARRSAADGVLDYRRRPLGQRLNDGLRGAIYGLRR